MTIMGVPHLYNWRSQLTANGVVAESPIQLFPIQNDPNALFDYHPDMTVSYSGTVRPETLIWTPGNNPMDLLDYMRWGYTYFWSTGTTARLADSNLPKKVFVPTDGPNYGLATISAAVNEIKKNTGKVIYTVVSGLPGAADNGYTIRWNAAIPYQGANADFQPQTSTEEGQLDIVTADVNFDAASTGDQTWLLPLAEHELRHGMLFWPHAPQNTYLHYYFLHLSSTRSAPLEIQADKTAYRLRPGTDLTRYDKLPQ